MVVKLSTVSVTITISKYVVSIIVLLGPGAQCLVPVITHTTFH